MKSGFVSRLKIIAGPLCGLWLMSCHELTGNPGLPAGTPNPSVYNTLQGALGMRNAALSQGELAMVQDIIDTGLLTDELEDPSAGASPGFLLQSQSISDPLDERILPSGVTILSYSQLQGVRALANQAIGALATYDTAAATRDSANVLRGELYALEGYAEIMLADLFCSGVPLSTLDFQKDYTYAPGSTTDQVYQDAIAKFDTALAVVRGTHGGDSVTNLASVGLGRAYLDRGSAYYAVAADDVSAVPQGFQYQIDLPWKSQGQVQVDNVLNLYATVSDREGINGLPYRSSGDPRTAAIGVAVSQTTGDSLYFPVKYKAGLVGSGYAPFVLANDIEARLIEAEAQLQPATVPSGPWLTTLNTLRKTAMVSGQTTPLDTLTDPGAGLNSTDAATARVRLLFAERANWLFLTGHRQGDLRRLLRQYGSQGTYVAFNSQDKVYPTGPYLAAGTGRYGTDVVAPIPVSEAANPLFHGCLNNAP